jgi:hypothetical protein
VPSRQLPHLCPSRPSCCPPYCLPPSAFFFTLPHPCCLPLSLHPSSLCSFHEGYLSVNFSSNYYMLSQRHKEVPRLTPAHLEVREWLVGGLQPAGLLCGWPLPGGSLLAEQGLTEIPAGSLAQNKAANSYSKALARMVLTLP